MIKCVTATSWMGFCLPVISLTSRHGCWTNLLPKTRSNTWVHASWKNNKFINVLHALLVLAFAKRSALRSYANNNGTKRSPKWARKFLCINPGRGPDKWVLFRAGGSFGLRTCLGGGVGKGFSKRTQLKWGERCWLFRMPHPEKRTIYHLAILSTKKNV